MFTSILLTCLFFATYSQSKELKPISMPALGQQFTLGVLYDRRKERILEGPKLWNSEELGRYHQVSSYGTYFKIIAASNVKESMSIFDLSASLKMAFLSGTISVQGGASYLQDRKTRNRQARISLGYKSNTFKRTLSPELFTKVTYPEVLKQQPDATDVVVAIQYGAGAIFTFDRFLEENEDIKDIQGKLHISVTKIPAFSINGTGYLNLTEAERKEVEKFSCQFHGDFNLKTHPGTYKEAIEVYKQLPKLLGENFENSVPVFVWLYPIKKLPIDTPSKMVYDITDSVVSSVTDVIVDMEATQRECNDILASIVARRHGRIHRKVTDFSQYLEQYILKFKEQISKILPEVRKGASAIGELTKLVSKKEASPFSKRNLEDWLSYYKEEVDALSKIQSLPNYCRNDGDFGAKLLNGVRFTVGLTLQLGTMDEPYLDTLKHYLENIDYMVHYQSGKKWFSPGSEVLSDLYVLSTTVRDFNERMKEKRSFGENDIQFLVREKLMEGGDKQGITIEFYDRAALKDKNYPLTSPPGRPKQSEKTYQCITLKWSAPTKGLSKLKNYHVSVYVRRIDFDGKDHCSTEFCKIKSIPTSETEKQITGLKADTPYFFTISTFTDLGETSISPMTNEIVTNKCSPGTYHVTKHECKECGAGTFSDKVGKTSCDICPAGTYNPTTGATTSANCINCVAGTYSAKEGATSKATCTPCRIGTSSSQLGASDLNACQRCARGHYGDHVGSPLCKPCPENTYNRDEGQTLCQPCPPETHTKSTGATSSSECIGKDAVAAAERRVNDVKAKVGKVDSYMDSILEVDEMGLDEQIRQLPVKEKELHKDLDKLEDVVDEMKVVHRCTWSKGEGTWRTRDEHTILPHANSRQACIYQCMKLRKMDPSKRNINGVTRQISTSECTCIQNMIIVQSSRYEHCKLNE